MKSCCRNCAGSRFLGLRKLAGNVLTLAGFRRLRMGEDPLPLPVGTRPLDQTKER